MTPRIYVDTSVIGGCLDEEFKLYSERLMSDFEAGRWNFKHIVSLSRIRAFNAVNLKLGYPSLEIRSPLEVSHD